MEAILGTSFSNFCKRYVSWQTKKGRYNPQNILIWFADLAISFIYYKISYHEM